MIGQFFIDRFFSTTFYGFSVIKCDLEYLQAAAKERSRERYRGATSKKVILRITKLPPLCAHYGWTWSIP